MKVDKNKVVKLAYELVVDGKVADKATQDRPLDYIHGTHMLLPKFESEVEGKEPGDSFEFTLTPAEGYGEVDQTQIIDLPKTAFMVDGKLMEEFLVVGQMVPMMSQDGRVVQGIVREVSDDSVKMDFNHPMAGKTLNFKGNIVEVRDATEKELTEGLHGEFLPPEEHHHCKHHGDGECWKATRMASAAMAKATRMESAAMAKVTKMASAAMAKDIAKTKSEATCGLPSSY